MADELVDAVNQTKSTLLVASEEVFPVAADALSHCPTVKASWSWVFLSIVCLKLTTLLSWRGETVQSHKCYIVTKSPLKHTSESCVGTWQELVVFGDGHHDCISFSSLLTGDMSHFPQSIDINPLQDLLELPFSSGTTGLPKGVMLTHSSIYANIEQVRYGSRLMCLLC